MLLPFHASVPTAEGAWVVDWWFRNDGDRAVDLFPLAVIGGLPPPGPPEFVSIASYPAAPPHSTLKSPAGDVIPTLFVPPFVPVKTRTPGAFLYVEDPGRSGIAIGGTLMKRGPATSSFLPRSNVESPEGIDDVENAEQSRTLFKIERLDPRILVAAVALAVILVALVWHSMAALPRWRAVAFWVSVLMYGLLRACFQSAMARPAGATVVGVAGFAITLYLAWWLGGHWTYLIAQVALASIFLGAMGWAIDSAALALSVPDAGIVEWFFSGIDFLLPFAAITGRWKWRWWTLLFFPVHFAGHLLPADCLDVVHWSIAVIVAAIALRTTVEHKPFSDMREWVPTLAFGSVVAGIVVAGVGRPRVLISLVPALAIWVSVLGGLRLRWLRRHWAWVLVAIVLASWGWFLTG